ncbi:hypothetical protein TNIN_421211 [Trichonephila inaurata madagascariensis]|uniref:Uncharacterized protein n=1 Tax=Trichonephila inaurata madagascariensis TaxID=2747483 RepID=A0A8X6YSR4_9ARAC|nr:hypothetical protein TNIN_421211 [Trichonephila inaurata madagascariensis]
MKEAGEEKTNIYFRISKDPRYLQLNNGDVENAIFPNLMHLFLNAQGKDPELRRGKLCNSFNGHNSAFKIPEDIEMSQRVSPEWLRSIPDHRLNLFMSR